MAVTEFAILRVPEPNMPPSARLLAGLKSAKHAMETYSGFPFAYLHCVEDPSVIYIIGAWSSVDFHVNDWIPSRENQDLLRSLKDEVSVDAMFHLDIDRDVTTPVPTGADVVVAVGRHFVRGGQRDGFERAFELGRKYLEDFAGRENVVGGWRIDGGEDGKDEFVLFTGWESKERHMDFAKTDGFVEYAKIKDYLDGADVKHATLLNVDNGR